MVTQHTGRERLTAIITVADRMWRGILINWLAASPLLVNPVRAVTDASLWHTDQRRTGFGPDATLPAATSSSERARSSTTAASSTAQRPSVSARSAG